MRSLNFNEVLYQDLSQVKNYCENFDYKGRGKIEPEIDSQEYVLNIIKKAKNISRQKISDISGIPYSTLYYIIDKLIKQNIVKKSKYYDRERGRPENIYSLIKK